MSNEVEGLLQRAVTGEINAAAVSQATSGHIASMDNGQLQQHLQTAADNANQSGNSDVAQQIMALVSQHGSNPDELKAEVITFISNNPQVLQHFEAGFAQGVLGQI